MTDFKVPYMWTSAKATLKRFFEVIDADSNGSITEEEGLIAGRAITGECAFYAGWYKFVRFV